MKKIGTGAAGLLLRLLISVAIAAGVLCLACLLVDEAIPDVLEAFFLGPLEDEYSISEIFREMVPLIFTGAAVSLMVRCGQFNMFVEGAFFGGAFLAGVLAPILGETGFVTPLVSILAAALLMALIGYIPAKMKTGLGINEFVSSLMLNYIVYWIVIYLLHGVAGDPEYVNATRYLEDGMRLPFLNDDTELSSNLIIALAVSVIAGIFLFRSRWGYALRETGNNPKFARYAGIDPSRYVVLSQVMGAGLAGMGGASFLLGNYYRFTWTSLPNYGFDGFVIAIIADNNPLAVPFAALFLGYLRVGALQVSRLGGIPNEVIYVIQAIIIILFGAKMVLRRHRKGGARHA